MIFRIRWEDNRIDWCTAKDQLHLLKSYDSEFDLCLQDIESIEEISMDEAKEIQINDTEFIGDESQYTPLSELVISDDFALIASSEFD